MSDLIVRAEMAYRPWWGVGLVRRWRKVELHPFKTEPDYRVFALCAELRDLGCRVDAKTPDRWAA